MAQTYQDADQTLIAPMATAKIAVQAANSGTPGAGVLIIVGEADAGPVWSAETKLQDNSYGPDEVDAVKAKYLAGPIVDAMQMAAAPLSDDRIPGALRRVIIVKSNTPAKATSVLQGITGAYGTLVDKQGGQLGNLISRVVTEAQAEVIPTTGSFTFIPQVGTLILGARINGDALLTSGAVGANGTPTAFVAAVDALAGITAAGGAARTTIQASVGNLAITGQSGNSITIGYTGVFTTTPSVGDTVVIPVTSVIAGPAASVVNVGAYVVTAATSASITCTKLSNAGDGVSIIGAAVVAPQNDAGGAVTATVADGLIVYSPVTISLTAGAVVDGLGKSLELIELASGTDLIARAAFQLGTTTAVTWLSKTGTGNGALLTSAAEQRVTLAIARQVDGVDEDCTAGGDVALLIGYTGTTASITISDTTVTSAVTGGAGAALPAIDLADFPTISDLAAYINAQTGWTCTPGTTSLGQLPATALDDGTFTCATTFGVKTGRVKIDAYRFFNAMRENLSLVQLGTTAAQAASGLPIVQAVGYLANGARGGTTAAQFLAAIEACKKVRGNAIAPLVSRDASLDIIDGLTDASSTWTIAGVNAAIKSHCIAMQKLKARRNRLGFVSIRGTYAEAKSMAGTMASARIVVSFLDQLALASTGLIVQFHPWMDSIVAAAGMLSGGYRNLTRKFKNISGSIQAAGDWTGEELSEVEDALQAGLLPTVAHEEGGFLFSSDQTSYSRDSNEVYNSFGAMYIADQIALDAAKSMEDAFVGESISDAPANLVLAFLETKFLQYLDQKLLTKSDDAPQGFRNPSVKRSGPAIIVKAEIKLNGTTYFIPISFLATSVSQTATSGQ